jgi:WD40 repeat protein
LNLDRDGAIATGARLRRHVLPPRGNTIALSPDGRTVAIGAALSEIVLFDIDEWKELDAIPGVNPNLTILGFSPDGANLGSYGFGDDGPHVWDVRTGRLLGHAPSNTPLFCFDSTSEAIITADRRFHRWTFDELNRPRQRQERLTNFAIPLVDDRWAATTERKSGPH